MSTTDNVPQLSVDESTELQPQQQQDENNSALGARKISETTEMSSSTVLPKPVR
jgi:hypothetical protein